MLPASAGVTTLKFISSVPPVIVAVLVVSSFNPVCPVVYENVNPLSAALTRKTTTVVPPDELLGTYIPISLAVKSKEGNV
jgi:hypothetical protein